MLDWIIGQAARIDIILKDVLNIDIRIDVIYAGTVVPAVPARLDCQRRLVGGVHRLFGERLLQGGRQSRPLGIERLHQRLKGTRADLRMTLTEQRERLRLDVGIRRAEVVGHPRHDAAFAVDIVVSKLFDRLLHPGQAFGEDLGILVPGGALVNQGHHELGADPLARGRQGGGRLSPVFELVDLLHGTLHDARRMTRAEVTSSGQLCRLGAHLEQLVHHLEVLVVPSRQMS